MSSLKQRIKPQTKLKQKQKQTLTPKNILGLKLLQLNQIELREMIQQEIADNPVLDEQKEDDSEEQEVKEERPAEKPDWESYFELRGGTTGDGHTTPNFEDRRGWDYNLSEPSTLADHLLWQLRLDPSFSSTELNIGESIIYNLNENGFFESSIAELSSQLGCIEEDVESVLVRIQHFDPVGVASRSLEECLLCQMNDLGLDNELNRKIIEHHLNHLKNKNYSEIAKQLHVSEDRIHTAVKTILTLDPKPGIHFQPTPKNNVTPEVFVYKRGEEFVVSLDNDARLPKLCVSPQYRKIAEQLHSGNSAIQDRKYLADKIKEAEWFIDGIEKRKKTILIVVSSLVYLQKDFFNKGPHFLKPMNLDTLANDVEMHLSTISRVTRGKYVQTPHGVFELKYFFSGGLTHKNKTIATTSVKQKMLEYIKRENPAAPLTDKEIVDHLAKDHNIETVPRTIGKYRKEYGIPNSRQRKVIL